MKTKKYFIEFSSNEQDMSTKIEISYKTYIEQLEFLTEQMEQSKDNEYPIEKNVKHLNERADYTETITYFWSGTGTTYLTVMECKEGYRFLTKGEQK